VFSCEAEGFAGTRNFPQRGKFRSDF